MRKTIPQNWLDSMILPVISAPMFLVSGPELVREACLNGVIGSFPAPNARPIEVLESWMSGLNRELTMAKEKNPDQKIAPWAINMVVHRSYGRLEEELALIRKYQPQLVITSLGSPKRVVDLVHEYGGLVFSDVSDLKFAKKAAETGVDGLILVASGAGGHAGEINSFAFVDCVRNFWDGIIVLAGSISTGYGVLAAQSAGADLAYMGTRFIAAKESMAKDDYRQMLVDSTHEDLIYTDAFSGVKANMLKPSIIKEGLDPDNLRKKEIDFSHMEKDSDVKAWRDIWSAGHGVGSIKEVQTTTGIVKQLEKEYLQAQTELVQKIERLRGSSIL